MTRSVHGARGPEEPACATGASESSRALSPEGGEARAAEKTVSPLAAQASAPNKYAVLYTVLVMTFMATLDSSIVNVALPVMARELSAGMGQVQWVSSIYLLTSCSVMLLFGRLADMVGKVRVYQAGVVVFALGSALCGLSATLPLLIAGRVVQALGGSAALATNMGIITEAFPPRERGKSLGMIASFVALGMLAGPTLGGVLTAAFSWEAIFWVNVPIGLVAFLVGLRTLPRGARPAASAVRVDKPGAALMAAAIMLLFCGLTLLEGGVTPVRLAMVAAGLVLLAAFVAVELRSESPLVPLSVFRDPWFDVNLLALFCVFLVIGAFNVIMPFYLQDARGYAVGLAGLVMTVYPGVNFFVGPLSGALSDRIGCEWPTAAGLAVFGAGIAHMAGIGLDTPLPQIVGGLAFMSLGGSSFQAPNNSLIMGSAPRDALGFIGSLTALTRYLGMVCGITGGTAILYGRMSAELGRAVTAFVPGRPDAFMQGFAAAFWAMFAVVALAFCLGAVRLVRARLRGRSRA